MALSRRECQSLPEHQTETFPRTKFINLNSLTQQKLLNSAGK
ncbi:hypothetical protein SynPROSU1_01262 [Synechococcus sp. PROS-U-1]|nr:hypothetical protein SynPROSU1_01262 [Synechococcus sp. PROS-U-1]